MTEFMCHLVLALSLGVLEKASATFRGEKVEVGDLQFKKSSEKYF